jgi:malonyl-CoA O-methyltransferase
MGGNTSPERDSGLRTPRWRDGLMAELEALRGRDGRLGLTFEIAYGHAFKAGPRVRPDKPAVISLEDMRALVSSGRSRRREG